MRIIKFIKAWLKWFWYELNRWDWDATDNPRPKWGDHEKDN